MSLSPVALDAIRTVARQLGDLRQRVVFVGGVVRGLLITDPAVEGSRATKDVDVIIAGITSRAEYYKDIHARLRGLGFREDASGSLTCRWRVGDLVVDIMPAASDVLGFSNRWYPHAIKTATTTTIADGTEAPLEIHLVTAPSFLATKLEAFAGRGGGDYVESHDIEDIVAVVDGRPELLDDVESDVAEMRQYVGEELARHLPAGLSEALAGHLAGDAASQSRLPFIQCTLDRLRRCPRILKLRETVQSSTGGEPGANRTPGPWRYEILEVERRRASAARDHLVVRARLVNVGRYAGTVGDGRDVHIEDARGKLFPPLSKLIAPELRARGLPAMDDQAAPDEPFETCWVYELAKEARALRLLLPFDGYELPLKT